MKCDFCAEKIKDDAFKCKHCGSEVVPNASGYLSSIGIGSKKVLVMKLSHFEKSTLKGCSNRDICRNWDNVLTCVKGYAGLVIGCCDVNGNIEVRYYSRNRDNLIKVSKVISFLVDYYNRKNEGGYSIRIESQDIHKS